MVALFKAVDDVQTSQYGHFHFYGHVSVGRQLPCQGTYFLVADYTAVSDLPERTFCECLRRSNHSPACFFIVRKSISIGAHMLCS